MKKAPFLLLLLLFCFVNAWATTYYLAPAPNGTDTNDGLSLSTPWLTPNHALTCGDVILAAPSNSYSFESFRPNMWGHVTCPASNNVAWLKCSSFDACKIVVPHDIQEFGMGVGASYWGVQGWEISNLGGLKNGLNCFAAAPPNDTANIHHIIFANNIANVCDLAGFGAGVIYNGSHSVDYLAIVGNISYKAATSNTGCGSGIGVFAPVAVDHAPGTHIYIAGNLSYSSTTPDPDTENPNPDGLPRNCYDGNGIIFDTFDGHSQNKSGQDVCPYSEQSVIENNITLANDGVGVRIEYNDRPSTTCTHVSPFTPVYVRGNTSYGNSISPKQYGSPDCGELQIYLTKTTYVFRNLLVTQQQNCYGYQQESPTGPSNPDPALDAKNVDNTNSVFDNWAYSATGTNAQVRYTDDFQIDPSRKFSFDPSNKFGNPMFVATIIPGPPQCSGFADVPACIASTVQNFTPTNLQAQKYGYQIPTSGSRYDPLFPKWLCTANLPTGLVSMGCLNAASVIGGSLKDAGIH